MERRMAQAVKTAVAPLWRRLTPPPHHLLRHLNLLTFAGGTSHRVSFITVTSSQHRSLHFRSRGLRLPRESNVEERKSGGYSDDDEKKKKSRNEKKKEARRAVRWGMDLASFSTPQIKRILKVASLEREVFEALMLAKRLGPDVREGKRRQFNYIGKLLRDAQPELLGALIQATKDGDHSRLQALSSSSNWVEEDDDDDEEFQESVSDEEEQDSGEHALLVNKWFDGLVNKDIKVSNEVYSANAIEFDRQELRKLVRRVHEIQDRLSGTEEDKEKVNAKLMAAKRSLTRFLHSIAKRMPAEHNLTV